VFATRRFAALLATTALSTLAAPAAAAPPVAPIASKNVSYLRTLDETNAVSIRFNGNLMYLSTLRGLAIYDVARPDVPRRLGFLNLPHFQNEDVDMSVGGRFVLISNDPSEGAGRLYLIDVSNPAAPRIRSSFDTGLIDPGLGPFFPELPFGVGHTASCIADCRYAYLAGTSVGIAIVDLTNPDLPRFVKRFEAAEATGLTSHDLQLDQTGLAWVAGANGTAAYDVSNPASPAPKPIFRTDAKGKSDYDQDFGADGSTLNDFIHHNSLRLRNSSLAAPPPGADLNGPSNVVLITEEDYQRPACRGAGSVQAWGISSDVDDKGVPLLHPLDSWEVEVDEGAQTLCSAHYFDERAGLLTQGWYEQGTRFLDVTNPRDLRQVGYWIPARNVTWGAYFAPTDPKGEIVYALDHSRGVDVIRLDRLAPPDPGPPPRRGAGSPGSGARLNLAVSITDGRRRALPGQRLRFALRVRNRSRVAARNVAVTARLPAGLSRLAGRRVLRSRTVSFRLGTLGARRVRTLRFAARVRARPGTRPLLTTARLRARGDISPLDDFATDRTLLGRGRRAAARSAERGASDHALALAVARMRTVTGPRAPVPTLTEASERFGALCRVLLG
jgi:uncharacterized repeat protein (TIGR01451 family)